MIAHIRVYRGGCYHHGIDLGDGTIIHFSGEPGRKKEAIVRRSSMAEFLCNDSEFELVNHQSNQQLPPEAVVANAFSRLGHRGYFLPTNNCEHFSTFCKTGQATSGQIRDSVKVAFKYSRYGAMNPWLFLTGPAIDFLMRSAKYAVHALGRPEGVNPATLRYTGSAYADGDSNNYILNCVGGWSMFKAQQGWVQINNLASPAALLPYVRLFAHTYVESKGQMVV